MFYKMIQQKCDQWYESTDCTIQSIIEYMVKNGHMRDAQINAIKTYLFLKIACKCAPLADLFASGCFNGLNMDEVELSEKTRSFLMANPAAAALFEYATLKNDQGEQVSPKLEAAIKSNPESIDYKQVFDDIFYNVSYTDYLFSLPMGAGKTYLMAAFIYLDLYFAENEPNNPAFAHNFVIFAPSGTKTSIVPSLRTIQHFDPTWVLPNPAAEDIKRKMMFEILDQAKTSKKSNKTKNPNVQKIASHQPLDSLFGLVAVTNAEKVILDRIDEKDGQISWAEDSDDEKDRQANELRNLIGKISNLSIFIDEVHHASSQAEKKDERKLRSVVNRWTEKGDVVSVLGFSGTPYFTTAEKLKVTDSLVLTNKEISNVVYYYPLIEGIGNFLKKPEVDIAEIKDSTIIVEQGVRRFLDKYKDTVYEGGLTAKLGIYCGTIQKCEEVIYPVVAKVVADYGLSSDVILKFHDGNKQYPAPQDSALQFASLDQPFSKIRIILLVQIGKEGWDCQSLTGIILSQEGDCPTNMVLQTSCRCLRQVGQSRPGTALIYLNDSNAAELSKQLDEQHHISVKEFESGKSNYHLIKRYDRTKQLKLPDVDFYQLKVSFNELIVEKADPVNNIKNAANDTLKKQGIITKTDLNMEAGNATREVVEEKKSLYSITLHEWLYSISKEGFGSPSYSSLCEYNELSELFDQITIEEDGKRYFDPRYDISKINANVRKAFLDKRDFKTSEELIPEKASLLNIMNFQKEFYVDNENAYYPDQKAVARIVNADKDGNKVDEKTLQTIKQLRELGQNDMADELESNSQPYPQKDRSYHYIPYKTDSSFEQTFLKEVLSLDLINKLDLEVYYNGDRYLTNFRIRCFKQNGNTWDYIGTYTPDFLVIKRKAGLIDKAVIIETKGSIYANDPMFMDKRRFMETQFTKQNNKAFGYERFDYLYIEDSLSEAERITLTSDELKKFFGGDNNAD